MTTYLRDTLQQSLAGRYAIEQELGRGGMATVFLAQDVRHRRRVAIKVLHPELSAVLGSERFLKEIELTASLQHPHILPLFDSGSAEGQLFYVMPYVEGETLRGRLERERQLPVAEALRIATEVSDALQYAHARGVVHRDIKPENILLQGGHALVADFGIALAVQQAGGERMTQTGLSLGTPQYMAPEQAMGEKSVDHRADVYALGAVLYEMLAGEPPFTGPTLQAIVARVMTEEPVPLHRRRSTVPEHIDAAVLAALEKLPADRPATADAFRATLADTATVLRRPRAGSSTVHDRGAAAWRWIALGAMAVTVLAVGVAATSWRTRSGQSTVRVVRFQLPLPPPSDNAGGNRIALTRDGSSLAYVDATAGPGIGIVLRRLDRVDAERLPGTVGARTLTFSPDGKSIAFLTAAHEVCVIPREGGTPVTVARGADPFDGIDWGRDGYLYIVTPDGAVSRVRATGGTVEKLSTLDSTGMTFGFRSHRSPVALPNGRAVLFSIWRGPGRDPDIGVIDMRTQSTRLLTKGRRVLGVQGGHLFLVATDGSVRAVPFDDERLQVHGEAITLLPGIETTEASAQIALADDGTLAYIPAVAAQSELVWVSGTGFETPVNSSVQKAFDAVSISPKGDRVALSAVGPDESTSAWMYDVRQQTFTSFSRAGTETTRPRWTPDGANLVVVSDRDSRAAMKSLWLEPADGNDTATVLVRAGRHAQEVALTPDSQWIIYREGYDDGSTLRDIRYVKRGTDTTSHAFAATKANEESPALSADGGLLAWVSDESGRDEVYVAPFPGPARRVIVSQNGGTEPVWARSGRELFYRAADGRLMAVSLPGGGTLELTSRRTLFDASRYASVPHYTAYDVAPDGRFLFIKRPPYPGAQVVVNWMKEIGPQLDAAR